MKKTSILPRSLVTLALIACLLLMVSGCGGSDTGDSGLPLVDKEAYVNDPNINEGLDKLDACMNELGVLLAKDNYTYPMTDQGKTEVKAQMDVLESASNIFIDYPIDPSSEAYPGHEKMVSASRAFLEAKDLLNGGLDKSDGQMLISASDKMVEGANFMLEASDLLMTE